MLHAEFSETSCYLNDEFHSTTVLKPETLKSFVMSNSASVFILIEFTTCLAWHYLGIEFRQRI